MQAVVTVPASCDDNQRSATKGTCRIAGLEVALGCALSVLTKSITMKCVVSGYGQRHPPCSSILAVAFARALDASERRREASATWQGRGVQHAMVVCAW